MSKRDVRRLNKIQAERALRSLDNEKEALWTAESNLGWVELDHPVRDGWEKSLVLRDDISRRDDVAVYLKLLSIVNHTVYSQSKNFVYRNPKTKQ